ncbi:MAG: inositol monophosphatase family protein, partial [Candidatus Limnocylindrus sp.]
MMRNWSDAEIATEAANLAGELLLRLRQGVATGSTAEAAFDADALRAAGDRDANRAIVELIANRRADDAVLSEEAADDPRRIRADRVWIVDPLDGTREFGERDNAGVWRDDFAVHIALWERGQGLTLGVVGLPARGVIFRSDAPPEVPPSPAGTLRVAVSRTRPPAFIAALEESGSATLVPMGSAGVKVAAVVSGEVDAYIHAGGQYQWDSAAPAAVALAAALGADACEIYTDVPGVLTTDPRKVPDAQLMDTVTCDEMLELASLGAAVLHPRAVEIARNYGVPLRVRS